MVNEYHATVLLVRYSAATELSTCCGQPAITAYHRTGVLPSDSILATATKEAERTAPVGTRGATRGLVGVEEEEELTEKWVPLAMRALASVR